MDTLMKKLPTLPGLELLALLLVLYPRQVVFVAMLMLCLPLVHLFAGVFLGNGLPIVLGLATAIATIAAAMAVKVTGWQKIEEGGHHG